MKFLAYCAAAFVLVAAGSSAGAASPRPEPHAYRVLGDPWGSHPARLVWQDGKARPVALGGTLSARVVSPDGRTVVFGSDDGGRLRFVDLVRQRVSYAPGIFGAAGYGCAAAPVLWSSTGRVVATGWCGSVHGTTASVLAVIDVAKRRIVSVREIGVNGGRAHAGGRSILLTPPHLGPAARGVSPREERLGPARLIRIEKDSTITEIELELTAGSRHSRTYNVWPGLAVRGHRALVVAEGEGVADIDLRTLRVRYHDVAFPPRPRRLAPPQPHEGTTNPSRDLFRAALWLDDRHVAVVGSDTWTRDGHDQTMAAGLRILDTRTWTTKLVDLNARYARSTGGGIVIVSGDTVADGLRAYDASGTRLFRRLAGVHFWDIRVGRRQVSVSIRGAGDRPRRLIFTLPSGTIVG